MLGIRVPRPVETRWGSSLKAAAVLADVWDRLPAVLASIRRHGLVRNQQSYFKIVHLLGLNLDADDRLLSEKTLR